MAQIPSYQKQRLPSANVGAAPLSMSIADTGAGAIGQGLQQLGAGVSNFAESMFKIDQMNRQSKDLIAETKLKQSIQSSELFYQEQISQDGDKKNWPKYRQQAIDMVNSTHNSLEWGHDTTKNQAGLMKSGWSDIFTKESAIGIVKANTKEAIDIGLSEYELSLQSTDDKTRMLIPSNRENARKALSLSFNPDTVEAMLRNVEVKAAPNYA